MVECVFRLPIVPAIEVIVVVVVVNAIDTGNTISNIIHNRIYCDDLEYIIFTDGCGCCCCKWKVILS